MEKAHFFFAINLILTALLGTALFFYTFTATQSLSVQQNLTTVILTNEISKTNKDLDFTKQSLTATKKELASVVESLVETSKQFSEALDAQKEKSEKDVQSLTGKISTVETQSKKQLNQLQQQSQEQISKLEKQLVNINVEGSDMTSMIEEAAQATVSVRTDKGIGSGAIIEPDGYIVTNAHVMAGASQGAVKTYDGQFHQVGILFQDADKDIAVLKIEGTYKYLKFGNTPTIGQRIFGLGSPAGLEFSVTGGIVSGTRTVNGHEFIQTDLSLNPGNSGGPLVDTKGELVGINNFKFKEFEGLGFAITAEIVKETALPVIVADRQRKNGQMTS